MLPCAADAPPDVQLAYSATAVQVTRRLLQLQLRAKQKKPGLMADLIRRVSSLYTGVKAAAPSRQSRMSRASARGSTAETDDAGQAPDAADNAESTKL